MYIGLKWTKIFKIWLSHAPSAKLPHVDYQPWTNTDKPWSWLHVNYVGYLNGAFCFVQM